jgi:hypothetical protein
MNPRSVLHALEPLGLGTPDVESLLSYFCRLAVSHSVSIAALSRRVSKTMGWEFSEKHEWHKGNLCGMGEAANNWSGALSALTSIERLDRLTLLPWQEVIAQKGISAKCARWCPECFSEDEESGRDPYFRLAWDVGVVSVCAKHKINLVHVCSNCGRPDGRHKSAYVIPGWCAHCGEFLGSREHSVPATPEEIWKASQIGLMLSVQSMLRTKPALDGLCEAIRELVTRLEHGNSAMFARRIGLSKGTVHHWLKEAGVPTLAAHLRISSQSGIPLTKLLTGDLSGWDPTANAEIYQMALLFPGYGQRTTRRELDWDAIRVELLKLSKSPNPVSVAEAARCLELDVRQLYLQANKEARILGERWKQYMQRRGELSMGKARAAIDLACAELEAEGIAINLREIEARVPKEILGSIGRVIDLLQEAKVKLGIGVC